MKQEERGGLGMEPKISAPRGRRVKGVDEGNREARVRRGKTESDSSRKSGRPFRGCVVARSAVESRDEN